MRVLVVNAMMLRLQQPGAEEQDWRGNLDQLKRLGHEVYAVTIQNPRLDAAGQQQSYADLKVDHARVIPSAHQRWHWRRFRDPAFIDGASWEYAQPDYLAEVAQIIRTWQPDVVWCHTSFMWAAARLARQLGRRTVIRSTNYEPRHEYFEHKTLANRVRFWGKTLGEHRSLTYASAYAAISPDEQAIYQQLAPHKKILLLPVRGLAARLVDQPLARETAAPPLRVFMMGATYQVPHNRSALAFMVDQILPRIRAAAPGQFEFHILGSKVPADYQQKQGDDLFFDGYVPDLNAHLQTMDIALMPSLYGQGMQQKVFEPLCYGFPVITHPRALAGYPLREVIYPAETPEEFVAGLLQMRDARYRRDLGAKALAQATTLFSPAQMDQYVQAILDAAMVSQ